MDQVHEELYLRLHLGSNSQSSAKGIKQEQDKTGANTKISRLMGAGSNRRFYTVSLHLHPVRFALLRINPSYIILFCSVAQL